MWRKPSLLRLLLQVRSRIGHGNEAAAGFVGADYLLHPVEEVRLEDVRLERRARLARDDEERAGEIDLGLDRPDLRGIGRVEHEQLRRAWDRAECFLPDFRAEARSAHAEEQRVGKAFLADFLLEVAKRLHAFELLVDDAEPSDPARLVGARPQRRVAGEEPARAGVSVPGLEPLRHFRPEALRAATCDCVLMRALFASRAAAFDSTQQLRERLDELGHAVGEQIVGDLPQRDAGSLEVVEYAASPRRRLPRGWRAGGRDRGTPPASPAERC